MFNYATRQDVVKRRTVYGYPERLIERLGRRFMGSIVLAVIGLVVAGIVAAAHWIARLLGF